MAKFLVVTFLTSVLVIISTLLTLNEPTIQAVYLLKQRMLIIASIPAVVSAALLMLGIYITRKDAK